MASQSYYNTGDEFMQDYRKDPYRHMDKRPAIRNAYSNAKQAYGHMPPEHQKQMQRKLQNLQKKAPSLAKAIATKKPSALVGIAKNLLGKFNWKTDWMFIILFSAGLIKDILDIIFAAAGTGVSWLPFVGQAVVVIGMTVSFMGELFFLCLTVVTLVFVGASIKNRGPAKYFVGTAIEFIAEAIPGISWLPWTPVYVIVLYFFVLYDRAYQDQGAQSASTKIPSSGAADGYSDQLAA